MRATRETQRQHDTEPVTTTSSASSSPGVDAVLDPSAPGTHEAIDNIIRDPLAAHEALLASSRPRRDIPARPADSDVVHAPGRRAARPDSRAVLKAGFFGRLARELHPNCSRRIRFPGAWLVLTLLLTLPLALSPRDYGGPTVMASDAHGAETPAQPEPIPPAAPLPPPRESPPPPKLPGLDGTGLMVFGSAMMIGGAVILGAACCSDTGTEFWVSAPLVSVGSGLLGLGIALKVRHTRIKRRLKAAHTAVLPPNLRLHPMVMSRGAGLGIALRR